MTWQMSALVLAWAAIVILSFAYAGLLRTVRVLLLKQLPASIKLGPSIGFQIPVSLAEKLDTPDRVNPRLILFVNSSCDACHRILPEIDHRLSPDQWAIVAGNRMDAEDRLAYRVTTVDGQGGVFKELRIPVTPFALVIDSSNSILDAAPLGSSELAHVFLDRFGGFVSAAASQPSSQTA